MRFYLITIQYNRVAEAENRTVPKAYDKREDAIAEFHTQMGKDMKNETLGWSLNMVLNSEGGIEALEKWVDDDEPIPVVEEVEVTE